MANLSNSRWAPASHRNNNHNLSNHLLISHSASAPASGSATPNTIQPTRLSKAQRDLVARRSDANKFVKLTRRLKWKSRTLLYSYHYALHERQQNVVGGVVFPMEEGESEMMFKIDFFEFYVLLERVLVHLLGIFGMVVSATHSGDTKPDDDGLRNQRETLANNGEPTSLREQLMEQHRQNTLVGDSKMFHGYAHRFHANVLAALDLPENPLHKVLGQGEVRDYLGIAKEFRNRWKDAEEKPADESEDGLVGSRYEKMLKDLNIEKMLKEILSAVDSARKIAEDDYGAFASTVGGTEDLNEAMMEIDEARSDVPLEAMPDAMEWD